MTKRQYAILFAALAGLLTYGREWLVLLGVMPFPETTFFDGFPNPASPVPAVVFVLGFLLREYVFSAWVAFFLPSLIAHHAMMLLSSGLFAMWPAFLGAHLLLIAAMLALMILGRWIGQRYQIA
jgi:hypothetical protein